MGIREDADLIIAVAETLPKQAKSQKDKILPAAQRIKAATAATTPATLQSIMLEPVLVTLAPGQSQTFTARALWSDGSTALPALQWSGAGGEVNQSGVFVAGEVGGTFSVTATASGGKAGSATVKVEVPVPPPPPDPEPEPPPVIIPGVTYLFASDVESGVLKALQGSFVEFRAGAAPDIAPTLTTRNPAPGLSHSIEFTFGGESDLAQDAFSELRFRMTEGRPEVYLTWDIYFPSDADALNPSLATAAYHHRDATGPDNNKLARAWDEDYNAYKVKGGVSLMPTGSGESAIIPEYGMAKATGVTGVGQFGLQGVYPGISNAEEGTWRRMELRLKLASSPTANDGAIELWENDTKTMSHTTVPWFSTATDAKNYFKNLYLLGWANSGYTKTTRIWVSPRIFVTDKRIV